MSALLEEVKKERERFVAFAFAAAEIFIEIDANGIIQFEGGAIDRLFSPKEKRNSKAFTSLIAEDDHFIFEAIMQHLGRKGRIGPIPLRFKMDKERMAAIRLFALRMPNDPNRSYLSLRTAALMGETADLASNKSETGLLDSDDFMKIAAQTIAHNPGQGKLFMTLAKVEGLEAAQSRFGAPYAQKLIQQILGHLKVLSLDGQAASQIAGSRFAFLHKGEQEGAFLSKAVANIGKKAGLTTKITTIAGDTGEISEEQLIKTLSYIFQQIAQDPASCNFSNLVDAYGAMANETQRRIGAVRSVIETGMFNLMFQPIRHIESSDIHHFEVFSRFDDRFDGESPYEIIRFAEDVGLIGEFDNAATKKCLDYIRKMKGLGENIRLSVNISGRTLQSPAAINALLSSLTNARELSERLIIEITETSAIEQFDLADKLFQKIRTFGCQLCLGDFGTGSSGYQYLRNFKVDFVKISGSYIQELGNPKAHPAFILSMVRLCRELGVKTIGEQVENRFQADLLCSMGVDYGQGYFFGRPSSSPQLNQR